MIQKVTIRRPLDPVAALVEDMYHQCPGDLAMLLGLIQQHNYADALGLARDLWGPVTFGPFVLRPGLSPVLLLATITYLRNEVVHPA